jgi:hypothetical protein
MPVLLTSSLNVMGALVDGGEVTIIFEIFFIVKRSSCTQSKPSHWEPDLKVRHIGNESQL